MTGPVPITLRTAVGAYPRTKALLAGQVASSIVSLDPVDLPVPNRAFAPMVRTLCFDVSEMAIATFLQAKSAGVPIVLLPVVLAARFQQAALLCLRDGPIRGPDDLRGRRIGVRAYSQTTAMWLRGILAVGWGLDASSLRWLTFEDAHVAGIADPTNAERAPAGQDLLGALRGGAVDAVIVGNEIPDAPDLRTVFADPDAEAASFLRRYGLVPVNHVLTMRADAARDPVVVGEVVRMFREAARAVPASTPDAYPTGRDAIEAAITLARRFVAEQGMLAGPLDDAAVWAGTPESVWRQA